MQSLFVEDISTVIFEKYLGLLQKAIVEEDLKVIEDFWQKSLSLGSRGLVIRTLIQEKVREVVEKYLDKTNYLLDQSVQGMTWDYVMIPRLLKAEKLFNLLKEGEHKDILKLIENRDYAEIFVHVPFTFSNDGRPVSSIFIASYIYLFTLASLKIDHPDYWLADHVISDYTRGMGWKKSELTREKIRTRLARIIKNNPNQKVEEVLTTSLGKLPEV